MFDVNDDMDELFRRAAENYPLKTDNADWEKAAKNLSLNQPAVEGKSWLKNGRNLLLLSMLLPAAFICNHYSNISNKVGSKTSDKSPEQTKVTSKAVPLGITQQEQTDISQQKQTGISQQKQTGISQQKQIVGFENTNHPSISVAANINVGKLNAFGEKSFKGATSSISSNSKDDTKQRSSSATLGSPTVTDEVKTASPLLPGSSTNEAVQSTTETNKVQEKDKDKVAQTENLQKNSSSKTEKIKVAGKSLHLYGGIIGSVDVSTVKYQTVNTPGTGAGILLGYQVTKRLSIESGIYKQKKFYYTDAKYYHPETPYTAPYYKLLNVDGNCNMFEVPINLKYDFTTSEKSKWYAVGGMSSYIMKKENYIYTSENMGQITKRNISYDNSSTALFSIINLSAGYQRMLGKSSNLRIEPYLKLPIKGFGWGRLPITSAGVNVGYTRRIF